MLNVFVCAKSIRRVTNIIMCSFFKTIIFAYLMYIFTGFTIYLDAF